MRPPRVRRGPAWAAALAAALAVAAGQEPDAAVAEALKGVTDITDKAERSLPVALADAEAAREAARETRRAERKIRHLRDLVVAEARKEAFAAVPVVVESLQKAARKRAEEVAHKKAAELRFKTMQDAPAAIAAASAPYEEVVQRAAASFKAWLAEGNRLENEAQSLQADAVEMQAAANVQNSQGQRAQAQRTSRQAHKIMDEAVAANDKATKAYRTAKSIQDSIPGWLRQAAAAAFHQEAMLNPNARPPMPLLPVR